MKGLGPKLANYAHSYVLIFDSLRKATRIDPKNIFPKEKKKPFQKANIFLIIVIKFQIRSNHNTLLLWRSANSSWTHQG